MTTESFPPPATGTDPAGGAAPITPVTPDMMDHAARLAAEKADAVAHDPSPPVDAREHPDEPAPAAEAPHVPESDGSPAPAPAAEALVPANAPVAASADPVAAEPVPARDAGGSLGLLNAKILEITAANVSASGEFVSALLSARLVKNATLKVYPGAPHGLTFTHKQQFNEDLLAFLRSEK